LTAQDDLVNNIAHDEGLRKSEKRCEGDKPGAQQSLPPVPGDERTEVLQVGL
jgi:hypothetical protein